MARRKTKKKAVVTTTVDDSQYNHPVMQGKVVSNYYKGEWIDRIYSTGFGDAVKHYLINKDNTLYQGKVTVTSRRMKTPADNFRQTLFKTADNRWFDNSGLPMSDPGEIPEETDDQPL